jgi:predicted transcriptional regulator
MNKQINIIFEELGFNDKEKEVYSMLLCLGPSTSSSVARELNYPRQTVHSILSTLAESGFLEEGVWKGVKKFIAKPETLVSVLDLRVKKAKDLKQKVEELMPVLTSLSRSHKAMPSIVYFEGEYGLKRIFDSILDQYKNGEERIFRGFGVNYFGKTTIQEILRDFVKNRFEKYKVDTRLFIARGQDDFGILNTKERMGRTIKHIDIQPQNSALYAVGDCLYLFSYDDEIGIRIKNKSMVTMLNAVFDSYWNTVSE